MDVRFQLNSSENNENFQPKDCLSHLFHPPLSQMSAFFPFFADSQLCYVANSWEKVNSVENLMYVLSHSVMSDSLQPNGLYVVHQAPLSMGFSRQEHWSGLPFPSPGNLPDPGIEPRSPALQADSLPTELWGKPLPEFKQPERFLHN